ncbi:MAG: histidinol dehydrogenase [Oscillospiraceae bacterium]|nr:histidinol dehydrogenase [Oscillospiraceae bacterium]
MIKIMKYGAIPNAEIFDRGEVKTNVEAAVAAIIADVRSRGDKALYDYAERFDGGAPEALEVTKEEIEAGYNSVDPELIAIMEEAAENIRAFHSKQVRNSFIITEENGRVLGQRVVPIEKVGLYVPGGTAAYPSTVLMDAIPAKIAGAGEIVIVTPAKGGAIPPVILAAAKIAGVDRIFRTGGAQAIAALAYGTESVPRVDKIVGPGNAYVAEAKKQVFGQVNIDMIAGPSEILVVADGNSDPRHLAADLLSQAEHDRMASAVLVTDSLALAEATANEIEKQLSTLPREDIARESVEKRGKIIVCGDILTAVDVANEIAPEHLELCVDDPFALLGKVKNAGSVFMGRNCPEAMGDYFAGPNHTLPTGGTARFSSPLSVDDFVKKIQYSYYTRDSLEEVYEKVAIFARAEGLEAHARSVESRFEGDR